MSNGYGVDFYGVATYGFSQPADYSVAPFNAYQTSYNRISLAWGSPNIKTWKSLMLVRSLYGYPSTPADGTSILTVVPTSPRSSFDDLNLLSGRIYYYTMFITVEAPAYSAGTTYSISQVILYNGLYWRSLSNSNTGNTPAAGSAFWVNTQYIPVWYPAGYVASLSVTPNGYSNLLYTRVPQPYKVANSDVFANTVVDNPALQHYLSIFGYHLDMTKTEYDLYLQGNNPDVISATSLDILGQQLGFTTDYLSSPQLRRQKVKNAAVNYRLKGTPQSIHNAIAEITGWDSIITNGINLMRSVDQSSFSSPIWDAWNQDTTYFPNQIIQFQGYNYKNLVRSHGTAQQPTGGNSSNTWWQVQYGVLDANTLKNPTNYSPGTSLYPQGGYSTWGWGFNISGFAPPIPSSQVGIYTGLPHPTDGTIKNWNALAYNYTGGTFPASFNNAQLSTGIAASTVWNNSTNYVPGNYVTIGTGTTPTYVAQKPSGPGTPYGFITPGTNEIFWNPIFQKYAYATGSLFIDNLHWQDDAVVVNQYPSWNSTTQYKAGDQREFFGIVYQAANPNINSKPTGNYYSNKDWIMLQPADISYTTSSYNTRLTSNNTSTATNLTAAVYVTTVPVSLPATGFIIGGTSTFQNNTYALPRNYISRFVADYPDLNGINDNSLADLGRPWTATPSTAKLWRSSYGMASVDQTLFGTTTYVYLLVNDGRSDCIASVTFATDYTDTAHLGHGIIFRYQDANNFWYATRKTVYLVSGGVETAMGTYASGRLPNNSRMAVFLSANTISISATTGTPFSSTLQLSLTNSTLQTATKHGLIQKYSPSGAV